MPPADRCPPLLLSPMTALATIALVALLVRAPSAEAQVLDTLTAGPDSTDFQVETYFVQTEENAFFEPHSDEKSVGRLIRRVQKGQCRSVTLLRAANQKNAAEVAARRGGKAINVRLILRCEKRPQRTRQDPVERTSTAPTSNRLQ